MNLQRKTTITACMRMLKAISSCHPQKFILSVYVFITLFLYILNA